MSSAYWGRGNSHQPNMVSTAYEEITCILMHTNSENKFAGYLLDALSSADTINIGWDKMMLLLWTQKQVIRACLRENPD
jgi:hypothetical protein